MSLQRIFSLFIGIISLVGIIGSRKLPLFTSGNIAEGFAPLFYSLGLFVCAVLLFFLDKSKEKFHVRASLLQGAPAKAVVFFLFNILMLILLYLFGPFIAMLVFSILAGVTLKRQTLRTLILFSAVFVGFVYFIFVVIVKLPFDNGIIFDMVRDL
jgi:ammonia channel protein AmtB